jgi:hypothetical protein
MELLSIFTGGGLEIPLPYYCILQCILNGLQGIIEGTLINNVDLSP